MKQHIVFFVGHSACGKGTQTTLLKNFFVEADGEHTVRVFETGKKFRELIQKDSHTAKKTKAYIDEGKLPPAFLGVTIWTSLLIETYSGTEHVVIDGTPRVPVEVPIWETAFDFYDWYPHIVYLNVSDEWAREKMHLRGREDDKDSDDVEGRIAWFHSSVIPSIDLLKKNTRCTFHEINGEQSIEEVHSAVLASLGLISL